MLSFYEFFNILENQKRKNIAEATFDLKAAYDNLKAKSRTSGEQPVRDITANPANSAPPAAPPAAAPPATSRYEAQPNSLSRTDAPAPDKTESPAKELKRYGNISKLDARVPTKGLSVNRPEQSKNMTTRFKSIKGKDTGFQSDAGYVSWFNDTIKGLSYKEATKYFIKEYNLENSIRVTKKIGEEGGPDPKNLMDIFSVDRYTSMPEKPFFFPVNDVNMKIFKMTATMRGFRGIDNNLILIDRDTLNHLINEIIEYFNVQPEQSAIEHTESLEQKLQNDAMSERDPDKKAIFDLAFLMSKNIFNKKIKNLLDEDGFMVKETFAEKLKEESIQNLTQKLNMIHNNMKSNTPSDTEYPNDIDADKEAIKRNALDKYKKVDALDALNILVQSSNVLKMNIFSEKYNLIGINYDFSDTAKISSIDWANLPKMKKENSDYIDVMDLMEYWGN